VKAQVMMMNESLVKVLQNRLHFFSFGWSLFSQKKGNTKQIKQKYRIIVNKNKACPNYLL